MNKFSLFENSRLRDCLSLLISILSLILLDSCNGSDDISDNDIIGTWYGTHTHYNPASGTKYSYLTVRFESSGVGELEYDAPTSYSCAKFTYSISGDMISCSGAWASTTGDLTESFSIQFQISGDRLIPQSRYTQFILTRDDSVLTTGQGQEVVDHSDLLKQVWKERSGWTILVIDDNECTEYVLSSENASTYSNVNSYSYYYDPARKYINIEGNAFDVQFLDEEMMQLKRQSDGEVLIYDVGNRQDIPLQNGKGNASDATWKSILESSGFWYLTNKDGYFKFGRKQNDGSWDNSIIYVKNLRISDYLDAKGTYYISSGKIYADYTDIYWDRYASADLYPGWERGGRKQVIYTIISCTNEQAVISDGTTTYYLTPYY